ncbi:MAG TPA: TetR/AcrR family transcriptional regulator [Planctomycetaceae bacterium]|nr:TetR/AcrR family transcriptional regulator [Planctomycetaceae bacterium]
MKAVKQPRALATRKRLVGAAARLLALKGYHDTKLEEVLAAANVTTGAFFHHFRSKEDLAFTVIERHMENRRGLLDVIERDLPQRGGDDPLALVCRRLDAIAKMIRQRGNAKGGCIIGNLCTALSDTHAEFREKLSACFDEMAREFKHNLDLAVARHRSKRRVDTWELARYAVAVIEGSIMLSRAHQDRRIVDRHFDHLKDYLRQAVSPGGRPRQAKARRAGR